MKRIIAVALCVVLALTFVASCSEAERPLTVSELLEVAERYLLEGSYEQALVEFMKVIEIDPMELRGYTGAADAYIGLGRYDEAVAILEQGLSVLPDNVQLLRMFEDLRPEEATSEFEPEPESEPELEPMPEILSALPDLLEFENSEALEELLDSEEFHDFINQIQTFPMIYLEPCGTRGIGVYRPGRTFIYIGEFYNQMRSGYGVWIELRIGFAGYRDSYSRFDGEWRDDLPNGHGIFRIIIRDVTLGDGITSRNILNTYEGNFLNGRRHGIFYEHQYMSDGRVHHWTLAYELGYRVSEAICECCVITRMPDETSRGVHGF